MRPLHGAIAWWHSTRYLLDAVMHYVKQMAAWIALTVR